MCFNELVNLNQTLLSLAEQSALAIVNLQAIIHYFAVVALKIQCSSVIFVISITQIMQITQIKSCVLSNQLKNIHTIFHCLTTYCCFRMQKAG
ncbi:hypothetical protein FGO68_gene9132 [Halteria grandinella]|uniref:Uncharacterized protein n=1 Tax=Halteria grandinella TaxID=5974 RepID=A0A8J8NB84_HALGN|nr:hypothetical protein FGO68_gene9132 [Halteria grandinella]